MDLEQEQVKHFFIVFNPPRLSRRAREQIAHMKKRTQITPRILPYYEAYALSYAPVWEERHRALHTQENTKVCKCAGGQGWVRKCVFYDLVKVLKDGGSKLVVSNLDTKFC